MRKQYRDRAELLVIVVIVALCLYCALRMLPMQP